MIRVIDFPMVHGVKNFENNHKVISDKFILHKSTLAIMNDGSHAAPKHINNSFRNKLVNNVTQVGLRSLTTKGFLTLGIKECECH